MWAKKRGNKKLQLRACDSLHPGSKNMSSLYTGTEMRCAIIMEPSWLMFVTSANLFCLFLYKVNRLLICFLFCYDKFESLAKSSILFTLLKFKICREKVLKWQYIPLSSLCVYLGWKTRTKQKQNNNISL